MAKIALHARNSLSSRFVPRRLYTYSLLSALLLLSLLQLHGQPPAPCPPPSHIAMTSGTFSSQPGVTFRLSHFVATLQPREKTAPGCYQKDTVLSRGEIFISNESLTRVFESKLEGADSKIKNFKVQNGLGKVTLSGNLNKVIPIAFTIEGPVSTDGKVLQLDASKIKADGIPIKALLELVGQHLSALFKLQGVAGVAVTDNTLSFSPEQIAHLKGHIDSAESTPQGLVLRYGKAPHQKPPAAP